MAWLAKGDVARATTLGREATRHADACGIGILQSWTRLNLTRSLLAAGELEEARRAIEEYERIVVAGQAGALLFVRGLYLLATGDLPRALEHLAFVTEGIRMAGIWSVSPAIDCALALALLAAEGSGAAGRVDELMARAEAVVDEHGYELHRPEIRLVRADLLLALGDESAASREIEVARQEYRRMGAVSRAAALDGRAYVLVTGDRRGTGSS
jgi:tetratricopeptide (TPR) repeat protein